MFFVGIGVDAQVQGVFTGGGARLIGVQLAAILLSAFICSATTAITLLLLKYVVKMELSYDTSKGLVDDLIKLNAYGVENNRERSSTMTPMIERNPVDEGRVVVKVLEVETPSNAFSME